MSEIKPQSDLRREWAAKWVEQCKGKGPVDGQEEVAIDRLVKHMESGGVIVLQQGPDGKTPGQVLVEVVGGYCDWDDMDNAIKRIHQGRADRLLSIFAPRPPSHIKGTTLGELAYIATGGTSSVYISQSPDWQRKWDETARQLYVAFGFAPRPEPSATVEPSKVAMATLLAKLPVVNKVYMHNGKRYVVDYFSVTTGGEHVVQYHTEGDEENWFVRPLAKWLEGDYQLVEGECGHQAYRGPKWRGSIGSNGLPSN